MFRRLGWVIMIALIVAWVTWGLFRFAVDLGRRTALIIGVLAALDALFIWLLATASASVLRYLRNPYQLHRIIRMGAGAGARWAACTIIVEGPALVLVRTRTVDPKTYLRVIDAKLLRNWRPLRPSLLRGEREFWVDKRGRCSGSVAVSAERPSFAVLPGA